MMTPKEIATIRISGGTPLWALVLVPVLVIAAIWLANWKGYRDGRKDILAEIAVKSRTVNAIMAKGNTDAVAVETEVLKELGDQEHALAKAERDLAEARNRKPHPVETRTVYVREPMPDCPRVPARCLQ